MPGTPLSLGAFHRLAPWTVDAGGVPQAGPLLAIMLQIVVVAELLLPVLLVAGLFTRSAAGGLAGIVAATALVDLLAHGVPRDAAGMIFDSNPFGGIVDATILWAGLLAVPLALGPGLLSLDALRWRLRRRGRNPTTRLREPE